MKRLYISLIISLLILSFSLAQKPEKYIPKTARKQEKCATAEPGTYLKPLALTLLNKMNQLIEDSAALKKSYKRIDRLPSSPQKKVVDTVICFNDLEVPVRIYYPKRVSLQGNQPLTLYFHGGGFLFGSVESYHVMVSKLARICGQIFVSVNYRLAPEHPFPAAISDCYAVLRWLQMNGSSIGADTTRIAVMGDSAGGNIATVITLICRERKTPQPFRQVLLYPGVTFLDIPYPSMTYFLKDSVRQYVLSEDFLRRVRTDYTGIEADYSHPYISPLEATLSNDLAPALIISAECDPLRDSGRLYAEKLEAAGVDVSYLEYSGMIHAFMSFHMILSDAMDAMKEVRDYLWEN